MQERDPRLSVSSDNFITNFETTYEIHGAGHPLGAPNGFLTSASKLKAGARRALTV